MLLVRRDTSKARTTNRTAVAKRFAFIEMPRVEKAQSLPGNVLIEYQKLTQRERKEFWKGT